MENQHGSKKIDIEENNQEANENNQENNIVPMEEESENKDPNEEVSIKTQAIAGSSDLNCSTSTNCSNNSKNSEKSNNSKNKISVFKNNSINLKIQPLFKINIQSNNSEYLYNREYFDEIYTNLLLEEKKSYKKIEKDYMDKQYDINHKMRAILVDWLIEVHLNFHFKRKTLFQTIQIIDLFLSKKLMQKNKFQLLGIASLLISCKENEIFYPPIEEFVNITNNAFTKKELFNMEVYILKVLNFEVLLPTSEEFYNIISEAFNFNKMQHHLGEYFLDSALVDYEILRYKPSAIGLACAYIVMKFYGINGYKDLYDPRMMMEYNYPQKTIKECAKALCFLVQNLSKSTLKAAKDKYSLELFGNVAQLCENKIS
jgi:cyclin B